MSELLRIHSVDVQRWGRASGFSLPLPLNPLVVVHGPNESGKTSLATALAWLLAGPGSTQLLHRFGTEGERLEASLQGSVDSHSLRISTRVKVPRDSSKRTANESFFDAAIDETALSRDELTKRLGGGDFDGYRRYYCVGALEVADGNNLQENVTIQAVFGGIDPFAAAHKLSDTARGHLGSPKGRAAGGTARDLQDQVSSIDTRLSALSGARGNWVRLETAVDDATARRDQAESRIAELGADARSVRLGVEAHRAGTVASRAEARRKLAQTPEPSDADRALHEQTTLASSRIGDLSAAERSTEEARGTCEAANADVDAASRPLIAAGELGRQALEAATSAESHLKTTLTHAADAELAKNVASHRVQAAEARFTELEAEWRRLAPAGLTPEDASQRGSVESGAPSRGDSRTAAPRAPRGPTAARWAATTMLAAIACFVALAAAPGSLEAWAKWAIAGSGVVMLGVGLARVLRPGRPLDSDLIDLAGRFVDAREERNAAHRELGEKQRDLDTQRGRADAAQRDYRQALQVLAVPSELVEQFEPDMMRHLKAVRKAQSALTALDGAEHEEQERRRIVIDLLADTSGDPTATAAPAPDVPLDGVGSQDRHDAAAGESLDAAGAKACLGAVCGRVDAHNAAERAARDAEDDLMRALQYDEAALACAEKHSQVELHARGAELETERDGLQAELAGTKEEIDNLNLEKRALESPDKTTAEMSLERSGLWERIEIQLLRGLAHHLAARLLGDTAERHRTEQQPELLRRTEELVCGVADWHRVTVNPHAASASRSSNQTGNLLVEGPWGSHSDERLSLGALALLYLALRLATVERQAKSQGVRRPLILDDVLIGLDDQRAEGCLGVLAEFSKQHQLILLTCHDSTAERAAAAGAAVLAIPPP